MQRTYKLNLKMNFIPKGLEKYMSFNIINKLIFIDSFQFLNFSLDSLLKYSGKDNILSLCFKN